MPKVIGAVRDATGSFAPALYGLAALLALSIVLTLTIRRAAFRAGRDGPALSPAE